MKQLLRRWHRNVGLSSCLFVIVVVITGLLIQHAHTLNFDQKHISSAWLMNVYGISLPERQLAFVDGDNALVQLDNLLYINEQPLISCDEPVLGFVTLDAEQLLVLCDDSLVVASSKAEVLERITAAYGLPEQLSAIVVQTGVLLLQQKDGHEFRFDIKNLVVTPHQIDTLAASIEWSEPVVGFDFQAYLALYQGQGLTWERVLLDLHSGSIAGDMGVFIVDIASLLFLFLALSGFWIWLKSIKK